MNKKTVCSNEKCLLCSDSLKTFDEKDFQCRKEDHEFNYFKDNVQSNVMCCTIVRYNDDQAFWIWLHQSGEIVWRKSGVFVDNIIQGDNQKLSFEVYGSVCKEFLSGNSFLFM